jgi:monolysocardiolipin acyltransferase
MWLTGFDQLMPEGRAFPYKYIPRPGAQLSVTFGDPLPSDTIKKALGALTIDETPKFPFWDGQQRKSAGTMVGKTAREANCKTRNDAQHLKTRIEVTTLVQRAVESLGRSISGDSLHKSS